ncbi:hypothetical protein P7K49_007098 [Saguinus oedipus]|uniref:Dolichyl-diphosphooligosaccharide--protein glycosyltransferase subunit TMEM258 n=1 Tax=Saguinus oedipus TaxID=9490 RepID=A0ABQ9VTZ1_SAGOE|nr:hypothetical protein P7K49_007098 [Saguinus oedipus]
MLTLIVPFSRLPFSPQIGERQQVLVTEESFDSKFYVAHNRFYEQIRGKNVCSGSWLESELEKTLKGNVGKSNEGRAEEAGCLCGKAGKEELKRPPSIDIPQGIISDWAVGPQERELFKAQTKHAVFSSMATLAAEGLPALHNPAFMGKMVEVDIYESGKHFMKGRPVSDARVYTPSISKPLAKGEVSGLTKYLLFKDLDEVLEIEMMNMGLVFEELVWLFRLSVVTLVTSTKYAIDIYKELLISLVASLFMGFEVLFLCSGLASLCEHPRLINISYEKEEDLEERPLNNMTSLPLEARAHPAPKKRILELQPPTQSSQGALSLFPRKRSSKKYKNSTYRWISYPILLPPFNPPHTFLFMLPSAKHHSSASPVQASTPLPTSISHNVIQVATEESHIIKGGTDSEAGTQGFQKRAWEPPRLGEFQNGTEHAKATSRLHAEDGCGFGSAGSSFGFFYQEKTPSHPNPRLLPSPTLAWILKDGFSCTDAPCSLLPAVTVLYLQIGCSFTLLFGSERDQGYCLQQTRDLHDVSLHTGNQLVSGLAALWKSRDFSPPHDLHL